MNTLPRFIAVFLFCACEYVNDCTRCTQMHTNYYIVDYQYFTSKILCVQNKDVVCKTRLLCAKRWDVCRVCANLCRTCALPCVCVLIVIACKSEEKKNVCSRVHVCAAFYSRACARISTAFSMPPLPASNGPGMSKASGPGWAGNVGCW